MAASARCPFLPGNPVAALVGMLTLGLPLLHRRARCVLAEGFARRPGRIEYVPVRTFGGTEDGLPLVERTGPAASSTASTASAISTSGTIARSMTRCSAGRSRR